MSCIIDSNVFIGWWDKTDQYHGKSLALAQQFREGKVRKVYVTNYVVLETINFLLKRVSFEQAEEAYSYFRNTEGIEIVYVDATTQQEIEKVFEKYKNLSLTDCSLIMLAHNKGIREIYSFDSGFDKVKDLQRKGY